MSVIRSRTAEKVSTSSGVPIVDGVREYWDQHVHDWKIATHAPGTREFFAETETYRFEKLHYLPLLVDFDAYADKRLLDLGCGLGNDLARFARSGAIVTGIDIAPHAIVLAKANFSRKRISRNVVCRESVVL